MYPIYAHSLDPTFEVKVTDPDLEAHPLLSLVHPMECILNAGTVVAFGIGLMCVRNVLGLILSRPTKTFSTQSES